MEKEFEALDFLKQQAIAFEHSELAIKVANENHTIVKQVLTEKQDLERFTRLVVEKNLIIAVIEFYAFNRNYEKNIALKIYNSTVNKEQELTQEEFDFIKEMIAKYGKRI